MIKIVCVGIIVQDRIYFLFILLDGGGKYQVNYYFEIGGGLVVIVVVVIVKFGVEVDFIGCVGDDSCGNILFVEFEGWGVNIVFCC